MTINLVTCSPRFSPGTIRITRGASETLRKIDILEALLRHFTGDWGDLDEQDKQQNDEAVNEGDRILSRFSSGEEVFWIITEADRSATTILLPNEY